MFDRSTRNTVRVRLNNLATRMCMYLYFANPVEIQNNTNKQARDIIIIIIIRRIINQ